MTAKFWVGGTGNWSDDTNHWALSSGGAPGAGNVPVAGDDVTFDNNSSAAALITVTIDVAATCNNFTCSITNTSQKLTIARSAAVNFTVNAGWTNPGSTLFAWSGTSGTMIFAATATGNTITTNGVSFVNTVQFNGVSGGWTLGGAFVTTGSIDTRAGTLTLAGFSTTSVGVLANTGTGTCSIDASTGTPTLTVTSASNAWIITNNNFSFSAGASQITCSAAAAAMSFNGNGLTYNNVSFTTSTPTQPTLIGANTFANLTFAAISGTRTAVIQFNTSQTITGTLSINSGQTTNLFNRYFVRTNALATVITLTAAAIAIDACDFRDITGAGAAAPWALSTHAAGDCGGNSGITFAAPKTVFWNLTGAQNWTATAWATTSAGAPAAANFPLPQDTAKFTDAGAATTVTLNLGLQLPTIDFSGRTTTAVTFATGTQSLTLYGHLILSAQVTQTGTGTATFADRSATQNFTTAGLTPTWPLTVNGISTIVQLQDNLTMSAVALTVTQGQLDLNAKTLTLGSSFSSTGTLTRSITDSVGGGKIVNPNAGSTWTVSGSGFTANTGGPATISMTNAAAKTFAGGGFDYSAFKLSQDGAGDLTISGSNSFLNITNTVNGTNVIVTSTTTQTLLGFTLGGTAAANTVLKSSTPGSAHNLSMAAGWVQAANLTISDSHAAGGAVWDAFVYMGNVDATGNTGWVFADGIFLGWHQFLSEPVRRKSAHALQPGGIYNDAKPAPPFRPFAWPQQPPDPTRRRSDHALQPGGHYLPTLPMPPWRPFAWMQQPPDPVRRKSAHALQPGGIYNDAIPAPPFRPFAWMQQPPDPVLRKSWHALQTTGFNNPDRFVGVIVVVPPFGWFRPLDEPTRRKSDHANQTTGYNDAIPAPPFLPFTWMQQPPDPVRRVSGHALQPGAAVYNDLIPAPPFLPFGWFKPLDEPTRRKSGHAGQSQGDFAVLPMPVTIIYSQWGFAPLSEPTRRKSDHANQPGGYFLPPFPFAPPPPLLGMWFRSLDEPTRRKSAHALQPGGIYSPPDKFFFRQPAQITPFEPYTFPIPLFQDMNLADFTDTVNFLIDELNSALWGQGMCGGDPAIITVRQLVTALNNQGQWANVYASLSGLPVTDPAAIEFNSAQTIREHGALYEYVRGIANYTNGQMATLWALASGLTP